MNQLDIHHKLVLFALMAYFLSSHYMLDNIYDLLYRITPSLGDIFSVFYEYFLPKEPSGYFLNLFVSVLGIAIFFLSIATKNEKINFALIPVLIYYAYFFPWWFVFYEIILNPVSIIDPYNSGVGYIFPDIVIFILLVYGSVNLFIKAQRAQKIVRDIKGRIIKYRGVQKIKKNKIGIAEELEKFVGLKEKGIISDEEFNKIKRELLK